VAAIALGVRHLYLAAGLMQSRQLLDVARWWDAARLDTAALRDELAPRQDGGPR
jgi:hypothetical protein